jgi:DNA-binding GntR family transcriptional regulator
MAAADGIAVKGPSPTARPDKQASVPGLAAVDFVPAYSRREAVIATLRRAILSGALAPGQRVSEVAAARQLGVSRPTLREAISQLIHEGLLVSGAYQGTHVAIPNETVLRDTADVRAVLETYAAVQLVHAGADSCRAALEPRLLELETAARSRDPQRMHDTHVAFHGAIYAASANALLRRMWDLIRVRVEFALTLDQTARPQPKRMVRLHRHLVETMLGGNVDSITRLIDEHIRGSAEQMAHLRHIVDVRRDAASTGTAS